MTATFATAQSKSTALASGPRAASALKPEDAVFASPEYVRLLTKWYASTLGLRYGPIYRRLGLSASQIAAVENVMAEQYQANMEARAAAVAQGISPSDTALAPLMKPIGLKMGEDLAEILGKDGAKEFFAEFKVADSRANVVSPLAGNLYYTDAPLTLAQGDRLTQIVAANTGGWKQSGLDYRPADTNWDVVFAQAQTILTPAQLATFRTMQEKDALQKQSAALGAALVRDAQRKATAPEAAKPKN